MVRLSFSKDAFDLWALPPCGAEPRPDLLSHVRAGNRVVEDVSLGEFVCSAYIRLVGGHLSNGSAGCRKECAFLINEWNRHRHIRYVRARCCHCGDNVRGRINTRMDLVAVPRLR